MKIDVLDATQDADQWRNLLTELPVEMQDLYFTPEYLALHSTEPNAQAICLVFRSGHRTWMYPSILRTFSAVGNHHLDHSFRDLEGGYGYGGPVSNSDNEVFLLEAHQAFREWSRDNRLIAEFTRLHPLVRNQGLLDQETEILFDRDTRSLDLVNLDPERPPFDSTTKNMLRRAERSGVRVECISLEEGWPRFVDLYRRTMDRVGADRLYYFNEQYFARLCNVVRKSGFLLAAKLEERWLAAAVFFKGPVWLHYHISASDSECRIPGVTNLLIWNAALLGRQSGLSRIHLGGGRSRQAGDSLLRFKTSMSSDRHAFFIGRRVHDADRYRLVKDLWASQFPGLSESCGHQVLCYHNEVQSDLQIGPVPQAVR